MGDSSARIRAYVRTRTRTHAGHAPRHKIDPPDRRLATISAVELRQIVFMKVNRCSSRGNCGDTFVRSCYSVSTRDGTIPLHIALSSLDNNLLTNPRDQKSDIKIYRSYDRFKTSSSESEYEQVHDIDYLLITIYIKINSFFCFIKSILHA